MSWAGAASWQKQKRFWQVPNYLGIGDKGRFHIQSKSGTNSPTDTLHATKVKKPNKSQTQKTIMRLRRHEMAED